MYYLYLNLDDFLRIIFYLYLDKFLRLKNVDTYTLIYHNSVENNHRLMRVDGILRIK